MTNLTVIRRRVHKPKMHMDSKSRGRPPARRDRRRAPKRGEPNPSVRYPREYFDKPREIIPPFAIEKESALILSSRKMSAAEMDEFNGHCSHALRLFSTAVFMRELLILKSSAKKISDVERESLARGNTANALTEILSRLFGVEKSGTGEIRINVNPSSDRSIPGVPVREFFSKIETELLSVVREAESIKSKKK